MYNEDRKMRFLTETRKTIEYGKSIFTCTKPYEDEAGMDLCELQEDVLQSIVNENFGLRAISTETAIMFIKTYVSWCEEQGYPVSYSIYDIDYDNAEKIRSKMVASPKHLELLLDEAFDPLSERTIDCLYRCFIWMAFAGLEEDEAVNVKVSEVDFDSMTIEHNGRSYEIYREAVPTFKEACTANSFCYINQNYTKKKRIYRDRFDGEFLFRGVRAEKIAQSTLKGVTNKKLKKGGLGISYSRVMLSGLFYRTYELEKIGVPVNFNTYIVDQVNKVEHKYSKKNTRSGIMQRMKNRTMIDYENWKAAFVR